MAHKLNDNFKVDATDPNNLNGKVLSEAETRKSIILHAQSLGCEAEMRQIFSKWDKALRNCKNDVERRHMSELGSLEIYMLLKSAKFKTDDSEGGKLYVNGKLVFEDIKQGASLELDKKIEVIK